MLVYGLGQSCPGDGCGMRITRIFVEKLFGIFDHEIPLNLDDRITIIHAPNGYGKTVILKMLNGLFNSQYSELRTIPYKKFSVEFDNGRILEVRSELEDERKKKTSNLFFTLFSSSGNKIETFLLKYNREDSNPDFPLSMIEDFVPGLVRISGGLWFNGRTGEEFTTEEVLERFADQIPPKFRRRPRKDEDWLSIIRSEVNIYLIQSQRLLSFSHDGNMKVYRNSSVATPLPTVKAYSDALVREIKERLAEYASVAQSLDRSFPTRVLRQELSEDLTNEDLRGKLDELEQHRHRLVESGLLEQDEEQNFPIQSQDIDEKTRNVLAVYAEDVGKKLDVFGDIADKIDLFRRIVNSKFSYKEIVVSRDEGFIFKSKYPKGISSNGDSATLSPSSLSSGEQHELVLLYELLFKVKENSLVLIDEPELSLHIGWQVNFLKDLQEISKLADLDLLIATHAPSLINDRWDLTVELKGVS
jgi:predicted ATP-binding protein involved in virulence